MSVRIKELDDAIEHIASLDNRVKALEKRSESTAAEKVARKSGGEIVDKIGSFAVRDLNGYLTVNQVVVESVSTGDAVVWRCVATWGRDGVIHPMQNYPDCIDFWRAVRSGSAILRRRKEASS